MTTAWLIGMGLKMGMKMHEILNMQPGEMIDCATCLAIANGAKERNVYTFDEIMEMH